MKLKHLDIEIKEDNPFANCKLGRQPYAEVLTNIVANYADGFVLAINNEWGTGKTTFVKMWQQLLKNQGYKTLYFNAWENDFENGALTALMAELSSLKEDKTEETFKKLLKTGSKLAKGAIPIILKAFAAKYLDKEVLQELFGEVTDNVAEMFHSQIEEYTSKKKKLKEFKKHLIEYVNQTTEEGKPIVFIIDELDRCRPNYAVDVLEKVKHFFDVPGIVFVLSIDKEQLKHAICGVYGSDNINADEYLRRFIDLQYSIPEPNTEQFCNYLYNYFEFDKFLSDEGRTKYGELKKDKDDFLTFILELFQNGKLTLRQQEKLLAESRVALNSFGENQYLFPHLFLILLYIKSHVNQLYKKIKNKQLSQQELCSEFEKHIPIVWHKKASRQIAVSLAYLLFFYNNYLGYENKITFFKKDDNKDLELKITSKLNEYNDFIISQMLDWVSRKYQITDLSLIFFLERVDLIHPFKSLEK